MNTYWNGEPCEARKVRVVVARVADAPPMSWYLGLEGTERNAVEVHYGGYRFYLDDDDEPVGLEERRRKALEAMPPEEGRYVAELLKVLQSAPRKEAGHGWAKVTVGRGSPQWPHRHLPVEKVLEVLGHE
jgi:hypothetical protein